MADVICPGCNESYHSTTEAYRPGEVTTGNMLTLKPQYRDNGWTSFPEHGGMQFGDLWCPGCEAAYSTDGRVRVDMEQYAAEQSVQLQGIGKDANIVDERKEFPGTEYAMAEVKEEKRKPGRPKRA